MKFSFAYNTTVHALKMNLISDSFNVKSLKKVLCTNLLTQQYDVINWTGVSHSSQYRTAGCSRNPLLNFLLLETTEFFR
jgi:hypothetical protein